MNSEYYPDNDEKSVVILMTSGPSTPHRCATTFYIGAALACLDVDVNIFLTMEGVKLAQRGIAEDLVAMENGQKIIQFIRDAKNAGVKLYVCLPALPGYKISETNLIDEVDETSGGVMLADMIISCDKVLSF